jgi:quinoprotein glucose dehydrogenase
LQIAVRGRVPLPTDPLTVATPASAMDDYLRAFDIETGAELWKGRLPAGAQAMPMTYQAGRDGKQFVVIAAGGHGKLGTKLGDSLIALALP